MAVAPHHGRAPGQAAGPKWPGLLETWRIAPAAPACQRPRLRRILQNSHILSRLGCQTTMCRSLPVAGLARTGIGTASTAL